MQRPSVSAAFAALKGKRAVLIGDLVLDAYVYGETVRVSREAPVLVVRKERTTHRLGGAANTAANLAALGLATTMVSALGSDTSGDVTKQMLQASRVSTDAIIGSDAATPVKTRILAGAFGTTRQQVLRIDDEPEPIGPAVQERLADQLRKQAAHADVVVVSDYGMGVVTGAVVDAVRELIARGATVTVDSRYQASAFAGATAFMPNVPEAEALAGFPLHNKDSINRAGSDILQRLKCKALLLTQGRGGMSLYRSGMATAHVDIVGEGEVTDVTGAGDTVTATFSAALAGGIGMTNGMKLANVAAGIVVTRLGTATATPEEITAAADLAGVELEPWDVSST